MYKTQHASFTIHFYELSEELLAAKRKDAKKLQVVSMDASEGSQMLTDKCIPTFTTTGKEIIIIII